LPLVSRPPGLRLVHPGSTPRSAPDRSSAPVYNSTAVIGSEFSVRRKGKPEFLATVPRQAGTPTSFYRCVMICAPSNASCASAMPQSSGVGGRPDSSRTSRKRPIPDLIGAEEATAQSRLRRSATDDTVISLSRAALEEMPVGKRQHADTDHADRKHEQVHRDQSQACSHMAVIMRHKRQRSIDDYQHRQEA
jgi:hypothetical protein